MWIISKKKDNAIQCVVNADNFFNLSRIERNVKDEKCYEIMAFFSNDLEASLGKFKDKQKADDELHNIIRAIANGTKIYNITSEV